MGESLFLSSHPTNAHMSGAFSLGMVLSVAIVSHIDNPSSLEMLASSLWCSVKHLPAEKALKINYCSQLVLFTIEKCEN